MVTELVDAPLYEAPLYTAAQVRELDRLAIAQGTPGISLMKRAARFAFDILLKTWPDTREITVLCGTGNNGGDGFVVAALARQRGITARVLLVGDVTKLKGDAALAHGFALQAQVPITAFTDDAMPDEGVLVDALLGTGLHGNVTPAYKAAIHAINFSGLAILSLDVPSGLCSDTGTVCGAAVFADVTTTFVGLKRGLFTGDAVDHVGEIMFDDLGITEDVRAEVLHHAQLLTLDELPLLLPPRARNSHKGHYGHVLVIGGDLGMGGAVLMAAEAAARTGAGRVSVATRPENVSAILARCPTIMAHGITAGPQLRELLASPTVIVVGPGLGRSAWSEQMVQRALHSGLPLVVDADALNIMAQDKIRADAPRNNWIFTPHPGEAATLLYSTIGEVQADRFSAVNALHTAFGGAMVLKGAGTLVCADDILGVAQGGNPGMASAGMGDVLSGVLGGLLAQGLDAADAAMLGVQIHNAAGDLAAFDHGERGLLATDLFPYIQQLVNDDI